MRIQPITNQSNFKGKLVQLSRNELFGSSEKTVKDLTQKLDKNVAESLSNLIADEPFDLFVYRFKQYPQFYEIAANNNRENILNDNYLKQTIRRVLVHSSMPESQFVMAAKSAIESFKDFLKNG